MKKNMKCKALTLLSFLMLINPVLSGRDEKKGFTERMKDLKTQRERENQESEQRTRDLRFTSTLDTESDEERWGDLVDINKSYEKIKKLCNIGRLGTRDEQRSGHLGRLNQSERGISKLFTTRPFGIERDQRRFYNPTALNMFEITTNYKEEIERLDRNHQQKLREIAAENERADIKSQEIRSKAESESKRQLALIEEKKYKLIENRKQHDQDLAKKYEELAAKTAADRQKIVDDLQKTIDESTLSKNHPTRLDLLAMQKKLREGDFNLDNLDNLNNLDNLDN